ncbi:MAG: DUF4091 domain-containing protein [Planctomycetota bacterium]|nr:DUF4091 domain-containing protein [Planctomycetota bacterium]
MASIPRPAAGAEDAGLSLHPASAMARLGGSGGKLPAASGHYALELVRGEREGVQCAVLPSGGEPVKVTNVALRAEEPQAPASMLYRVLAVNHVAPPTEGMFVIPPRRLGEVPDVLMPMEGRSSEAEAHPAAPERAPLTYYAEFHAPEDAAPGAYAYTLEIATAAGAAKLALNVRVRAAGLPKRLPFRSAVCWNWSLEKYYGQPLTPEEKRVFWDFCLDYRLSPCAFFSREPDPAPADLAPLRDRGLSVVCLMQVSGRKARALDEKKQAHYAPKLKQWRADLERLGLLGDAVVLLADEPAPGEDEVHRRNAAWLKAQFPELRVWLASRPTEAWGEIVDVFGVVTAHSTDLYKDHSHDAQAAARWRAAQPPPKGEYWWFHSVEPYAPYPNVRLDNLLLEGRIAGWQCAAEGVDGYEYFWIADWAANAESHATAWPERAKAWTTGLSGAGTLCYPDERRRPMPSLRLVNLRDGLEDWALIEQAVPRANLEARRALAAPVSKQLDEFTTDPEVIRKARWELMEHLEKQEK